MRKPFWLTNICRNARKGSFNVKKLVFVPLSDEMIYEHPELITGPIQAFSVAQPTRRTLAQNNEKATIAGKDSLGNASARALVGGACPTG